MNELNVKDVDDAKHADNRYRQKKEVIGVNVGVDSRLLFAPHHHIYNIILYISLENFDLG